MTTTRTRPQKQDEDTRRKRTISEKLRAKLRDFNQQFAHGGRYQCLGCGKSFRTRLFFDKDAHNHERQQDRAKERGEMARKRKEAATERKRERERAKREGRPARKIPGPKRPERPTRSRSEEHAHDMLRAGKLRNKDGTLTDRARALGDNLHGTIPIRELRDRDRARRAMDAHERREQRARSRRPRRNTRPSRSRSA